MDGRIQQRHEHLLEMPMSPRMQCHPGPDSKRKCPQDAPASVSSHTMGTHLYEKTEKARFTTPTHASGKNNFRKKLLQTLFTPDEEGAYFRRKPNPDKDQEVTTDDTSEESTGEGSAEGI
jgi:hypothetical protein